MILEPGQGPVNGFGSASLQTGLPCGLRTLESDRVVIEIKPPVQPPHRVQHERTHKSRGQIAVALENLCQSRNPRAESRRS